MLTSRAKRILGISLALTFFLMAVSPMFASAATVPGNQKTGPYIDKFILKNRASDVEVLSLLNNEVDLIGEQVDPQYLPSLQAADNINIESLHRNGYGFITMKCDKYPFNITSFRRALAFAIDKYYISDTIWAGLSQPQDSCVAAVNPYSIEGSMPYTYYESNMPLALQMLIDAGFLDSNADGWREAPNGDLFSPQVVCTGSDSIASASGAYTVQVLQSLGIHAIYNGADFNQFIAAVNNHQDYDILFHGIGFTTFDVDWLGYMFWSGYVNEPYQNEPCWSNASYDAWREPLLHSTNYTEVFEAAQEMQKIWIYNCPEIIFYENTYLSAYRTDKFEGTVNAIQGVANWWTNEKVHLKASLGGPYGGDYRWSLPQAIEGFNILTISSAYSWYVVQEFYDAMIIVDAKGNDVPWRLLRGLSRHMLMTMPCPMVTQGLPLT